MQRFVYFSKSLLLKVGTAFLFGLVLLTLLSASSASAQLVEPDFSLFEDPNEKVSSGDKTETEAEPPCISCGTQLKKNDSLRENKKVVEAIHKKKTPAKKEPECITCGRVKLTPRKNGSVAGADLWKQYPQIAGYSEHPEVKAMISYAERHSFSSSRGFCYKFVKEALCRSARGTRCKGGSLVKKYLYGTPVFPEHRSRAKYKLGKNAIKTLKEEGFINMLEYPEFSEIIKNPASAPKGSILVYSGGGNGGHIEIKTGHGTSGSYVSDFRAPDSIMENELAGRASKNYKLVGVMIKPAEKLR